MKVGCLGDIVFQVSDDVIKTFQKFEHSGSARLSTHNLQGRRGVVEYTGADPETVSLSFRLSKYLGVDPYFDLHRVENYCREGVALRLMIGTYQVGDRWLIKSFKYTGERFDGRGDLIDASVSVSLLGYDRRL